MKGLYLLRKYFDTSLNEIIYIIKSNKERFALTEQQYKSLIKTNKIIDKSPLKNVKNDITGNKYSHWTVLEYVGNKYWRCICSCGEIRNILAQTLLNGTSKSCGHEHNKHIDLVGQTIGDWTVLKYNNNRTYLCKCSCGKLSNVQGKLLLNGGSKSCGHNTTSLKDLTGKTFGDWEVIRYASNSKWLCRCSCGVEREVSGYSLRSGKSRSCGHDTTVFNDLTGKTFGEWQVLEYLGDKNWYCKCSCGTKRAVSTYSLTSGKSKSCGCKKAELSTETKLVTYGDIAKTKEKREDWQIYVVNNKDALTKYLYELAYKNNTLPTVTQLSNLLNIGYSTLIQRIHKFGIENYVNLNSSTSEKEKEVAEFIEGIYNGEIIYNDRKVLKGRELDILIPEKGLAIEFNGTYWHCSDIKDKHYHKEKTESCLDNNIRLIHIFEYEWDDIAHRSKLESLIKSALVPNKVIYARNTTLKSVDNSTKEVFENKYHIQGSAKSKINIGLYYNNELILLMTFGKPRFDNNYQYEIIRYTVKDGIKVVGGANKLFKNFVKTYNPLNVITYSDLSKFTGQIYYRLGFKKLYITEPNYVWVNPSTNDVRTRYETQKSKLIKLGLGKETDSEDTIMKSNGYLKLYDSGNIKLAFNSQIGTEEK